VWRASSRAASASATSLRRVSSESAARSGNRVANRSPIRKIALTVPSETTDVIGSCAHSGNCSRTSALTVSAGTAS
jgi:hypothetical protein